MNMSNIDSPQRRDFIKHCGIVFGAALAARPLAVLAAQAESAPLILDAAQWRTVNALCAQIIPDVDGLGAQSANCVNFIDKALAHEEKASAPLYKKILLALDNYCRAQWQRSFAEIEPSQQIVCMEQLEDGALPAALTAVEQQQFFAALRYHTILGFAAAPKFGGNRNLAGWKLMQFPGHIHEAGGLSDAQVTGAEPIKIHFHD